MEVDSPVASSPAPSESNSPQSMGDRGSRIAAAVADAVAECGAYQSSDFSVASSSSQTTNTSMRDRLSGSVGGGGASTASSGPRRSSSARSSGGDRTGGGSLRHSHKSQVRPPLNKSTTTNRLLSELTVNKLQFLRLGKLYGRDKESRRLKEAWEDVLTAHKQGSAATGGGETAPPIVAGESGGGVSKPSGSPATTTNAAVRRFVTIHGSSGTGKTALVAETLQKAVLREGGFYLQGKFPYPHRLSRQSSVAAPYAAFAAACSDLCELVVSLHTPPGSLEDPHRVAAHANANSEPPRQHPQQPNYLRFTLSEFRDRCRRDIGADAALLTRVIPGLLLLLSTDLAAPDRPGAAASDPDACPAGDTDSSHLETHHQLKRTFRRLLRAIASFGPIALVLDDVQWADPASLELLEALVSDREGSSLLIIGCCRDDAEYEALPHRATLESIRLLSDHDPSLGVDTISVGNLTAEQVNELLVDLLSASDADETRGLAECVHKKTLGNVFFVIQFLTVLHDAELLTYHIGVLKWTWDLPAIQVSMAATDNVVGLMTTKMKGLPQSIQHVLPIMACLGSTFSYAVLALVVESGATSLDDADCGKDTLSESAPHEGSENVPAEQPLATSSGRLAGLLLARCEQEGLVESFGAETDPTRSYMWVHDKIQEAAFSLISEDELMALKQRLGRILYEGFGPDELDRHLFTVVNLLDAETPDESTLSHEKPVEVAQLYLRAGHKANESSAFEQAAGYLATGIRLLPADHWVTHYELSLDLFSTAAEAEFCIGNSEQMRQYCDEVIALENRPLLDKRRAYDCLIDSIGGQQRLGDALDLCRSILAQLGWTFPNHMVLGHIAAGVLRFRSTIKNTTPEQISSRRAAEDETKTWTMLLLDRFVTYSYISKSDLLPLCIFKWLRLTINDGVSAMSPILLVLISFILVAFFQDYKGGLAFADHAVELLRKVKSPRRIEARVALICHSIVCHWLRPITLSTKPLLANYALCMATGYSETAAWSIYFYLEYSLHTGLPLEALKADCEFYSEQLREVKQLKVQEIVLSLWQCARQLAGDDPFDGALTGDIMKQDEVVQESAKDFELLIASVYRLQMYLAFVFGNYRLVYETIRKTDMDNGYFDTILQSRNDVCHIYAFNGLAMVSLYRETKEKKHLKMAKKFAAKIKGWARAGVRFNVAPHGDASSSMCSFGSHVIQPLTFFLPVLSLFPRIPT